MPEVLQRLSKWFLLSTQRPRSVHRFLANLSHFLAWADAPENSGQYEEIFSDSNLALEALKSYHTHLRSQLQSHRRTAGTAATQERDAIACMSQIHERDYTQHIEHISRGKTRSSAKAPEGTTVQQFASTLQALFDSAVNVLCKADGNEALAQANAPRLLRSSALDDSQVVQIRESYSSARLMDLTCVVFAGLVFVDSGANLAVLQEYEEPHDLDEQIAKPDRINLTQKAVKFRARGAEVEVHLSATTITRLRDFLRIRHALVSTLKVEDIRPLFIQCTYPISGPRQPTGISPLARNFLTTLRRKIKTVGLQLPAITLRDLRAYKQQELLKRAPIAVAAKIMGHSIRTALEAYSKAQESARRSELTQFLGSLEKTVLDPSKRRANDLEICITPVGGCLDNGQPQPTKTQVTIQPNCKKFQGCFFCDNYRAHSDAEDLRKLFSCRKVLKYIVSTNNDSVQADLIYNAVLDRIDQILNEIKRREPVAYKSVNIDVNERGQLTPYWANKIQQLYLLGMLPSH